MNGGSTKRCIFAIAVAAIMLAALVVPAANASAAAIRLTNQDSTDRIDGIDTDPTVGMHNSYAWCGAVFTQDDGNDYLWVGTNRDLGGYLLSVGGAPSSISRTLGIPAPGEDQAGKIYRLLLDEDDMTASEWELMWEDPAINGYRKMLLFNGDLYVFAGLTNVSADHNYSVVYRFSSDFAPGDTPDVVLWDTLPANASEYFRAAYVQQNASGEDEYLYVGTFDLKIWRTDGSDLSSLTPDKSGGEAADKYTGWDLVAEMLPEIIDVPAARPILAPLCNIWDIIWFNDALYVFVGSAMNAPPKQVMDLLVGYGLLDDVLHLLTGGFMVYKLTPNGSDWDIDQIVGYRSSAPYPSGLGLYKHSAASPFAFTVGADDFVYVTTFANGPFFLGGLAVDVMNLLMLLRTMDPNAEFSWSSFEMFYEPAAVYRFDTSDVWEVIVGDEDKARIKEWDGTEYTSDLTLPVPFASDYGLGSDGYSGMRAGFHLGSGDLNPSSNQYVWWMAEYDEKIWLSTWDMGSFREPLQLVMEMVFNGVYGHRADLDKAMDDVQTGIANVVQNVNDYAAAADDIFLALGEFQDYLTDIMAGDEPPTVEELIIAFTEMVGDIMDIIAALPGAAAVIEDIMFLGTSLVNLVQLIISTSEDLVNAALTTIALMFATPVFGLFVTDNTNPAGFDLYYSEDGVNFKPYTVNGLGDPNNYGGRVLIPSEYGLFVLTANPYKGCQVWLLNNDIELEPGIIGEIPEEVTMPVGNSFSFNVTSTMLLPNATVTSDNGAVTATIEVTGPSPTLYSSTINVVTGPLGNDRYEEIPDAYVYKVTLTGQEVFCGDIELVITIDGMELSGTISVNITSTAGTDTPAEDDFEMDMLWVAAAIAMIAAGIIGIGYLVVFLRRQ